jgi:hypothetical protein
MTAFRPKNSSSVFTTPCKSVNNVSQPFASAIAMCRPYGMLWCCSICYPPVFPTLSFACLASLHGLDSEQLTPSTMTYHLRRIRLHGLIEGILHTHRYRLTSFGLRVALFFTRTYDHLLSAQTRRHSA